MEIDDIDMDFSNKLVIKKRKRNEISSDNYESNKKQKTNKLKEILNSTNSEDLIFNIIKCDKISFSKEELIKIISIFEKNRIQNNYTSYIN